MELFQLRYFAAAAAAFAGPALRQASLETQHAFGAIGYAEEHEAPRHFRRSHLDAIALGGSVSARRELAAHVQAAGLLTVAEAVTETLAEPGALDDVACDRVDLHPRSAGRDRVVSSVTNVIGRS